MSYSRYVLILITDCQRAKFRLEYIDRVKDLNQTINLTFNYTFLRIHVFILND